MNLAKIVTWANWYYYWAKTRNKDPEDYHLLAYHNLDVAACFQVLVTKHHRTRKLLESILGGDVVDFLTMWIATHDIGKMSPVFQCKSPETVVALGKPNPSRIKGFHHSTAGYFLWTERMEQWEIFDIESPLFTLGSNFLAQQIYAHHGYPPDAHRYDTRLNDAKTRTMLNFEGQAEEDAKEFVTALNDLFDSPKLILPDMDEDVAKLSWVLGGAIIMCDWLGSTERYFAAVKDPKPLDEYWEEHALPQAEIALEGTNFLPKPLKKVSGIQDIYPEITDPRPMQRWASQSKGGGLIIIEDSAGSGKTEVAAIKTVGILQEELAEGFYIALPTQVSASKMLERITNITPNLFDNASHVFASGSARLDPHYREMKKGTIDDVEVNKWISDSTKTGLLSQVGVGTVDQALISMLKRPHQSLRLYGLSRNVLIIDEVHAYQTYQVEILKKLLEALSFLKIPVILLSATLPHNTRQELVEAYGMKYQVDDQASYPLVTHATEKGLEEKHIEAYVKKTYKVKPIHDEDEVVDLFVKKSKEGDCGIWFRNTVYDSVKAYLKLVVKLGPSKVLLAHSRFPRERRNDIEGEAVTNFGKDSTVGEREGKIVICTQIFQESVDLDFDYAVSDLCHIDGIIQRFGRVGRHARDHNRALHKGKDTRGDCIPVFVLGPKFESNPKSNWYSEFFDKGRWVYDDLPKLWNTSKIIHEKEEWNFPKDARYLIESVYGDLREATPPEFEKKELQKLGEQYAEFDMANLGGIDFKNGYMKDKSVWEDDGRVATRLGHPTTTVQLTLHDGGEFSPFEKGWEASSLNVSHSYIKSENFPSKQIRDAFGKALQEEKLKDFAWITYMVLEESNEKGVWLGSGKNDNDKVVQFRYDKIHGLLRMKEVEDLLGEGIEISKSKV